MATTEEAVADLLAQSLKAGSLLLGREETIALCEKYLVIVESDATVHQVTNSGGAVATAAGGLGDVYVPPGLLTDVEVGSKIHVKMIKTVSGRSPYRATAAEKPALDAWHTAAPRGRHSTRSTEKRGQRNQLAWQQKR